MANRLQLRRGMLDQWVLYNPLLAEGELAIELDTNKFKIGNGIDNWNDLPYVSGATGAQGLQGPKGDTGDIGPQGPTGTSVASFNRTADTNILANHAVISTLTGCTYADNLTIAHMSKVIGITSTSATASNQVEIYSSGLLDGFSNLTPNSPIYLSTAGTITQNIPSSGFLQKLGIAISTSEIIVNIGVAIRL